MTLTELATDIFETLGEPSDLDFWNADHTAPDTSSPGWARLVGVINRACLALSTWKWPNGRQVRMRLLEDTTYVRLNPGGGGVIGDGPFPHTITLTGLPAGVNLQAGKLLVGQTSGTKARVVWSNGETLGLVEDPSGFVVGETGFLYKKVWQFVNVDGTQDPGAVDGIGIVGVQPLDVIGVYGFDGAPLDEAEKEEIFTASGTEIGKPTRFRRVPRGFILDVWPEDGTALIVRYSRGPKMLGLADVGVEPELPVQFHFGIVLWGKWWGLARNLESNDAYAARKDLEDFMSKTRTEYDLQDEHAIGQIKIYPEGR